MSRAALLAVALAVIAGSGAAVAEEPADAVILSWDRHFILEEDGTVRRREHRKVKLLSPRAYRRYADPRIDYEKGRETVKIHRAVTHLPNGTRLPVPEYSLNIAAPNDVAGWPAYAAWEQRIVSFSGIEPGAVLELDYEVISKPGVHRWMAADIRLSGPDPVKRLAISVKLPEGTPFRAGIERAIPDREFRSPRGPQVRLWLFHDLPAEPDEPQSPPWRDRCGRLWFSTATDARNFVQAISSPAEGDHMPPAELQARARKIVGAEPDLTEQVRLITAFLKESFNALSSRKTWRSPYCRSAAEVLRSNYGNPIETAGLCTALLRGLHIDARPVVALDADAWIEEAPNPAAVAAVLVRVEAPGGAILVHPLEGPVEDLDRFGPWLVHEEFTPEAVKVRHIRRRGADAPSEITVTGRLAMDAGGKLRGTLRMRFTGLLFDPGKVADDNARKSFLAATAAKLFSGLSVKGVKVQMLTPGVLQASVEVGTSGPILTQGPHRVIGLGDGPLFLDRIPLPLGRSDRRTAVRLSGLLRERVDVAVEIPEGWAVAAPARVGESRGDWGRVTEQVTVAGRVVRLKRDIEFTVDTFAPPLWIGVHHALTGFRAPAYRHLVVFPDAE